jgi:hypothetical protein
MLAAEPTAQEQLALTANGGRAALSTAGGE